MPIKVIKTTAGIIISLFAITDVHLVPEECTGDGEYDHINTWQVDISTICQGRLTVFKTQHFDNDNETFYSFNAVMGENYEIAHKRYLEVKGAVTEENNVGLRYV